MKSHIPRPRFFRRSILILALCLGVSNLTATAEENNSDESTKNTVRLVIDFGDGSEKHFTRLAVEKETTCLELMKIAEKHPRGIKFKFQGKGATALLSEIDSLKNEGSGKNWIFRINGKLGERSFGIAKLKPSDELKWSFESYP